MGLNTQIPLTEHIFELAVCSAEGGISSSCFTVLLS
jgi:hypothetical protein